MTVPGPAPRSSKEWMGWVNLVLTSFKTLTITPKVAGIRVAMYARKVLRCV